VTGGVRARAKTHMEFTLVGLGLTDAAAESLRHQVDTLHQTAPYPLPELEWCCTVAAAATHRRDPWPVVEACVTLAGYTGSLVTATRSVAAMVASRRAR